MLCGFVLASRDILLPQEIYKRNSNGTDVAVSETLGFSPKDISET